MHSWTMPVEMAQGLCLLRNTQTEERLSWLCRLTCISASADCASAASSWCSPSPRLQARAKHWFASVQDPAAVLEPEPHGSSNGMQMQYGLKSSASKCKSCQQSTPQPLAHGAIV